MTAGDDDATVVLRRSPPPRRPRPLIAAVAIAAVAVMAVLGVLVWPRGHPGAPAAAPQASTSGPIWGVQPAPEASVAAQRVAPAPPAAAAPRFTVAAADERTILATQATGLVVFRYADDPHVLVLSFPSLLAQGRMLNRVAAFVEKAGMPHDRILSEAELDAIMTRTHDSEATFYLGHDYRAADLARFFATAARNGVPLRPEETVLRALLEQEGMLAPGAVGAVISIPPDGTQPPIDDAARATILHHELSHGLYFTDPGYAAFVRVFWDSVLTDAQRAGFRRFLGGEGYDTGIDDLMVNETQAYLMHTQDPRFFRPALAGLTDAEANALRRRFVRDMPASWLKTATVARLGGG
ncbi:MAG TPA: hypothetical protein VJY39_21045 [Acidisphaera sp.]|nr:hypothetical protein [Acidisphaera sp.]